MYRYRLIKAAFLVLFSMVANVHGAGAAPAAVEENAKAAFQSPRLQRLWGDLRAGGNALETFWSEVQGRTPLIEEVPGERNLRVTFLWRGKPETHSVSLLGLAAPMVALPLTHMEGTDLWFFSARLPRDARLGYGFLIDAPVPELGDGVLLGTVYAWMGRAVPDPLNPHSYVQLPDAPPQPWAELSQEVASGTLTRQTIRSEILSEDRGFTVYTPAGYKPDGGPHGLVIVFDGEAYGGGEQALIPAPVILDNLIAQQKIPPVVAVLLDSQATRGRDLSASDAFSGFLVSELLPWLRRSYRVAADPSRTVLAGSSLGGLCAAYTALHHPEAFGNVLSQSGAFWYFPEAYTAVLDAATEAGWLVRRFVEAPRVPLRFYLDVGRYESAYLIDNLGSNRRLRDVLEAKGYPVVYRELNSGHDAGVWRGTLADGLLALLGNDRVASEGQDAE